jgi:hypothetical protein
MENTSEYMTVAALDSTLDIIEASLSSPPSVESFSLVSDLFTDIEKMRIMPEWATVDSAELTRLSVVERNFEVWKGQLEVKSPEAHSRRAPSRSVSSAQQPPPPPPALVRESEIGRRSSVESFDFDQVNWEAFPDALPPVETAVSNESQPGAAQRSSTFTANSPFPTTPTFSNQADSGTFPLKFKVKVNLPWADVAPLILEGPSTDQQRKQKVEKILVDSLTSSCNIAKSRITAKIGLTTN